MNTKGIFLKGIQSLDNSIHDEKYIYHVHRMADHSSSYQN